MIGVGQADDGTRHVNAQGGGFALSVAGGLDNGDFVMAGRKINVQEGINVSNTATTNDIGLAARLNEDRYLDITGDLIIDVTFNFADSEVRGPAEDVSNYVLLRRGGTTGAWTKVSGNASTSGDKVTFTNVSVADANDGYYTIGTTSSVDSPLDQRFAALGGQSGTATNSTGSNSNGADAGYVTLGLPITGGTAGSVVSPDGSQLFTSTTLGYTGLSSRQTILYKWDYGSQSFTSVTDPTTPLENGRGLYLWVKDSPDFPVDPTFHFGLNDVSNEPTSNQTESVPDQSGTYVFLANPYLDAYDMTAFTDLDANGFQAAFQLWDKNNGGTYGSYVTKTQGTSGDDIGRYQGFFLERTSTGSGAESFTFDNTGRLSDQDVPLVGAKAASSDKESALQYRRLALQLSALDDSGTEVARDIAANLFFTNRADATWDAYDAVKYRPPSDTFATVSLLGEGRDGAQISKSQESVGLNPGESLEIPLQIRTKNVEGAFELSARDFESIPAEWSVTLVDTKENTSHDLSPGGEGCTFQADAKSGSSKQFAPGSEEGGNPLQKSVAMKAADDAPRFTLKIDPTGEPLPVELTTFDGTVDNKDVVLSWETASEQNNAGFVVQKKENGRYRKVTRVEGSGTSEGGQKYRHRVKDLEYGKHTFQLTQVDVGGATATLDTVAVEVSLSEAYELSKPYPNPFQGRTTVDLAVKEAQNVTVSVYNAIGQHVRTIYNGSIETNSTKSLRLDGRRLGSGLYFIRIQGETFTANRKAMLVR